jgi:hypothetical protein
VTDGYQVVDAVVQDYIQHGGNIVGEVHRRHPRTPWGAVAVMRTLARDYEGGDSPRQVVAAAHAAGDAWWSRSSRGVVRPRLPCGRSATALVTRGHCAPGVRCSAPSALPTSPPVRR